MKISLQAVVARFNSKIIAYEGINDLYTLVQLCVNKDDLDDITINTLQNTKYVYESDTGFNLGENEAKDYPDTYGDSLTVGIETFDIEVN